MEEHIYTAEEVERMAKGVDRLCDVLAEDASFRWRIGETATDAAIRVIRELRAALRPSVDPRSTWRP